MYRPAARQDRDEIEAHRQARVVRLARQPEIGGRFDSAQRIRRDRVHRLGQGGPRLDLDDGDGGAAHGDDVNLARAGARPPGDDPVALDHQRQHGGALSADAESTLLQHVEGIGDKLGLIFKRAAQQLCPPHVVAEAMAEEVLLAQGRQAATEN